MLKFELILFKASSKKMADPKISFDLLEDVINRNNIFGILDFIKIPNFCGSYSPYVFFWIKQINVLLSCLKIPEDMEGAFIMTFLDGEALDVLKMELHLGSFLPKKDTIYRILTQNFGYKFAILSTIIEQAGAELGQAQLKLGLGFTRCPLNFNRLCFCQNPT